MLHRFHRASACIIGAYMLVHLINHLLAIHSVEAHMAFMEAFRQLYRQPVVEFLLLGCVLFQIASGLYFIKNRWGRRDGFFERLQAVSGAYLAYFLLVHVGAVLFGRVVLELDTNFYFAAAGIHAPLYRWYFLPYYFLAVVAFFGHVACAVHWLTRNRFSPEIRNRCGYAALGIGISVAALIVTAFSGGFQPVEVPTAYMATYGQ